ncbi:MAG TPA: S53 family peptidase [Thermoleophilaceae bacterium]|nr:S53 family peptidase [Thermoleophilaceae bacterium]
MLRVRHAIAAASAIGAFVLLSAPAGAALKLPPAGLRPHTILNAGCALNVRAGFSHCLSKMLGTPSRKPVANAAPAGGYGASDIQSAYALPSSTAGAGQTVAIVDAYDDPTAEADMGTYRSTYGLPACTTANGCFKKVNQSGVQGSYPSNNQGWGLEISLDLDMVSAACPQCHILLVEASSNANANLYAAEDTAARLGATEISNSYGGAESSSDPNTNAHFNHPGIAITVSSGDSGYGVEYPASSPFVTAVGGTTLGRASNTRGWSETAWSGAGSGCSAYEAKQSWQTDTGCAHRTVADVSAVADPNSGVNVYDSNCSRLNQLFGNCFNGWGVVGGTSASSPIIASVYALAGNASSVTYGSYPYSHTSALNDVTSGSNGNCSPAYLCTAGPGFDGPTGLGTPNGTGAF